MQCPIVAATDTRPDVSQSTVLVEKLRGQPISSLQARSITLLQERLELRGSRVTWRDLASECGFDVNYRKSLELRQKTAGISPVDVIITEMQYQGKSIGQFVSALSRVHKEAAQAVLSVEIGRLSGYKRPQICQQEAACQATITNVHQVFPQTYLEKLPTAVSCRPVSSLHHRTVTLLQESLELDGQRTSWKDLASNFGFDRAYQHRLVVDMKRDSSISPVERLLSDVEANGVTIGGLVRALLQIPHVEAARRVVQEETKTYEVSCVAAILYYASADRIQ